MSGRRPSATKVYSFTSHFREVGPTWTSFPGLFKNNGFSSMGAGKTFHPGLPVCTISLHAHRYLN